MKARVVYWKRHDYTENGFKLIEVLENGTIIRRTFAKSNNKQMIFNETHREDYQAKGSIAVEKIDFGSDGQLKKSSCEDKISVVSSFDLSDWETAKQTVLNYQKETEDNLNIDYHTMLYLEKDSVLTFLKQGLKRYDFPIIKFRFNYDADYFKREKYPEKLEIVFVPLLNEKLYFHYFPESDHLSMTGDDLFALDIRECSEKVPCVSFLDYVDEKIEAVNNNPKYYQTLINKQRERRAMLDTDVTGDLYPR